MKKAGFLLVVLIFTVSIVNAQRGRLNSAERAKQQVEQLTTTLEMDKSQVKKVETIILKYAEKQSEMFASMRDAGDRSGMREKMEKIREDQTKEIKKVLSEDQFKKYEKYLEEQAERRRQRMRNRQ